MADKKISALTASTTPLAGTEVLPIVQSGATVKVAVSDLTAGRAVSATQYTSTIATGTAPFVVSSTTNVANLNASTLGGATFASPGAIGSTTNSTGSFSSLGANCAAPTGTTIFQASSNGTRGSLAVKTDDAVSLYSLGTGTVTCSAGVLGFTSDERLKIADGEFSGGIEAVKNIIPQYFYWKDKNGQPDANRPRELGFFAQNIQASCGQEVVPDPHREDLHLGIHDRGVMAVLTAAIKEQQTIIESLTARLTALEAK